MTIPTPEEIDAMTPVQLKVFENRLRAAAKRQGLRLEKSRRRDPRALDYGSYWLIDGPAPQYADDGTCCNWRSRTMVGSGEYGITLADVAQHLLGEKA